MHWSVPQGFTVTKPLSITGFKNGSVTLSTMADERPSREGFTLRGGGAGTWTAFSLLVEKGNFFQP